MSSHLASAIRAQYGSLVQLKSTFSSAVTGMFTNGYVWFVTDMNGNTGIVPTFGPGTLLIRSRTYMGHSKNLVLGENLRQPTAGHIGDPNTLAETAEEVTVNVEQAEEGAEDAFELDGYEGYELQSQLRESSPPFESPSSSTSQTPPPGVAPASPVSGVSGQGQKTPTPPSSLHPRFMHSTAAARRFELSSTTPHSLYEGEPDSRAEPRSKGEMLNVGEVLHPLFCISVHEHAWMAAGYGVWGKEEWLKQFWSVLDWQKVSESYASFYKESRI